jgi:hypothetical protein
MSIADKAAIYGRIIAYEMNSLAIHDHFCPAVMGNCSQNHPRTVGEMVDEAERRALEGISKFGFQEYLDTFEKDPAEYMGLENDR